MAPTSVDDEALAATLDANAAVTPGVSTYCSAGDWSLAANAALAPGRELLFGQHDQHSVLVALSQLGDGRRLLQSAEADWGFASPALGPDPEQAARLLAATLNATADRWDLAVLSGLSPDVARRCQSLAGRGLRTAVRGGLRSVSASLEGGYEGFLSRRSAGLRAGLRRDARRVRDAGIEIEVMPGALQTSEILARAAAVEQRSWKGEAGAGMLAAPAYQQFYERVLGRAAGQGRARAAFARRDGEDVAFVFGAVLGAVYRGFQLGYVEGFETYGLGNQLQAALIAALAAEGLTVYDLGMAMPYKERWAERSQEHAVLVLAR